MLKRDGQAAVVRDSQAAAGAGKREIPSYTVKQLHTIYSQATAGAQERRRCRCKTRAAGASLEPTATKGKTVIAGTRRALPSREGMAQLRTVPAERGVNPETAGRSLMHPLQELLKLESPDWILGRA